MNWKMNYWTLLFALAALGLAYQRYAGGQHSQAEINKEGMDVSCPDSSQYLIDNNTAEQRIARYDSVYVAKVRRFAADSCNTSNGGVNFFGISKCELQTMAEVLARYDSVTALMTLIPGNGGAKDTLDLIFEVDNNLAPATIKAYYDFTKPCPPCSGGN